MARSLEVWCVAVVRMGPKSPTQQPKRCLRRDDSSIDLQFQTSQRERSADVMIQHMYATHTHIYISRLLEHVVSSPMPYELAIDIT